MSGTYRDLVCLDLLETYKRPHLITTIKALFLACEKMAAEKSAAESREQATYLATVKQRREIETMRSTWTKPHLTRKPAGVVEYETTTFIHKPARSALLAKVTKRKKATKRRKAKK